MALVFKDLTLDLSRVPDSDKDKVKRKVADLVYDEVLRYLARGQSPVAGEAKNFNKLDSKYAKKEKGKTQKTVNTKTDRKTGMGDIPNYT